jgi:hypothetical protein
VFPKAIATSKRRRAPSSAWRGSTVNPFINHINSSNCRPNCRSISVGQDDDLLIRSFSESFTSRIRIPEWTRTNRPKSQGCHINNNLEFRWDLSASTIRSSHQDGLAACPSCRVSNRMR